MNALIVFNNFYPINFQKTIHSRIRKFKELSSHSNAKMQALSNTKQSVLVHRILSMAPLKS
jgi:hypothetical protein